ncbi:MAG: bifunctional metallophosphatase/5'-nucleotidase [Polyangiaceae bacterium]
MPVSFRVRCPLFVLPSCVFAFSMAVVSGCSSPSSSDVADASTTSDGSSPEGSTADGASTDGGIGDANATDVRDGDGGPVTIQILAINDFHGNLAPPSGSSGRVVATLSDPKAGDAGVPVPDAGIQLVTVGGAAYLATHVKNARAAVPNTVVVSAGDMTGASPLVSALFHDEPAIEVMNAVGLDFNGVGNHEFDQGATELLRLQKGGCHPTDGCTSGRPAFAGATFNYLAANVNDATNMTLFPAYGIKTFDGVKVAFVGMTLEATPGVVSASGVRGLTFKDEVETVNALVPELKAKGVATIVVLVHQGNTPEPNSPYDSCTTSAGPVFDMADALDPLVSVLVTAHTHQAYDCTRAGKIVTSAASFGRLYTSIRLVIDPKTGVVTTKSAENRMVTRDVTPDPTVQSILAAYETLAAPRANRVVGHIPSDVTTATTAAGESVMGDVIADAMLEATKSANTGDAVIAFMNPGGIRSDITYAASGTKAAGEVTYQQCFTVQPFGNNLVTVTMTGAQIDATLEAQFAASGSPRILQVSKGFSYAYTPSAPLGSRVDPASILLDGVPVGATTTYRVTLNNFLAGGGDGFATLANLPNPVVGAVDVDTLVSYFGAHDPLVLPATDRIRALP